SRGYIDFDAVAVTSEVSPQEDGYSVVYEIREGQQYSFAKVSTVSEVRNVDASAFQDLANIREGATYNPATVDRVTSAMEKRAQAMGYGFVRVDPRITRNKRAGTLDIEFAIVPRRRTA
ncbi:MAG: outer membrane protein assembly factor BamA, partial [Rhodobacterales bacterium]